MKKFLCIFVCFLLICPAVLAESVPTQLTEEDGSYAWLREKSMAMALRFQRGLDHTWHSYLLSAFNVPQEEMENALAPIRLQDYTQPREMTFVRADQTVSDQELLQMADLGMAENTLPAELEDDPMRDLYLRTSAYLNSQGDERFGAISNALKITAMYPCPEELEGPCCAQLRYSGQYSLLITFYPLDNGNVSAWAQVVPASAVGGLAVPLQ